jgi:hypothetical protein
MLRLELLAFLLGHKMSCDEKNVWRPSTRPALLSSEAVTELRKKLGVSARDVYHQVDRAANETRVKSKQARPALNSTSRLLAGHSPPARLSLPKVGTKNFDKALRGASRFLCFRSPTLSMPPTRAGHHSVVRSLTSLQPGSKEHVLNRDCVALKLTQLAVVSKVFSRNLGKLRS